MHSLSVFAASSLLASFAFAGVPPECDMSTTPGIVSCLEHRTQVAEKVLSENLNELIALMQKKSAAQAKKLAAAQNAWLGLRNTTCSFAIEGSTAGEERGITEISCKLAETLKRVHEVEQMVDSEKSGSSKSFRDAIDGLVEIRDNSVSQKAIARPTGISIINREFAAAQAALMKSSDVKANRLRIKSLRLIDEGNSSVCKDASVYLAELGYFAHKTQKYMKIYVISDLNKDRTIRATRTSVQENLDDLPECP